MIARVFVAVLGTALVVAGAWGGTGGRGMSRAEAFRRASALSIIGEALFVDPALSASGRESCASCHDPAHAFGPPNAMAVQLGGADLHQSGLRAVPSLTYLQAVPQFAEHYHESDDEGDASVDNGPTGGLTWDGRVDRGRDQARIPLLSPFEMANSGPQAVVRAVQNSPSAAALRRLFGDDLFSDTDRAFDAILQAFEVYEQSEKDFYPYASKYDAYLAGKAILSPQEARGLALFNDPAKGNCAHCHMSQPADDGTPPQFTDYGFVAVGVPRNPDIPANADPAYFDLGLCGPQRTDLADHPEYCGMFKAPSLRNVAKRRSFFHNGVFHNLLQAVEFYAERDTNPEKWYPRDAAGNIRKFDDLPPQYRDNIDVEPPLDRHLGDAPAFSEADARDIVAFLETLNDGYRVKR